MPIRVTALRFHTIDGVARHAGDTYDVDADALENLEAQGMAARIDAAAAAPPTKKAKPLPDPLVVDPRR